MRRLIVPVAALSVLALSAFAASRLSAAGGSSDTAEAPAGAFCPVGHPELEENPVNVSAAAAFAPLPPIDADAPRDVRRATFALG